MTTASDDAETVQEPAPEFDRVLPPPTSRAAWSALEEQRAAHQKQDWLEGLEP